MPETKQEPIATLPLESPVHLFTFSRSLIHFVAALMEASADGVREVEIEDVPSNDIRVTATPDGKRELQVFGHKSPDISVTVGPPVESNPDDPFDRPDHGTDY